MNDELIGKVHCLDVLELMQQIEDGTVDAIATDPPFGASRPSDWTKSPFKEIPNNDDIYPDFIAESFRVLAPDGAFYMFAHWSNVEKWMSHVKDAGFNLKNLIVWDKMIHGLGDLSSQYAPQYELIIYAVKKRHFLRGERPKDILRFQRVDANKLTHPYEKPVALLEFLIEKSTDKGGLVVDPFCGSGTTAVACRNTGRDFIVGDFTAEYCAIAERRLAQPFTPMMWEA